VLSPKATPTVATGGGGPEEIAFAPAQRVAPVSGPAPDTPAATVPSAPPGANPQPPPVLGPGGNPLGLPPNKKCVDSRKWSFKLHHPAGTRVVDVQVFIDGKRKLHVKSNAIERITIKTLPKKRFKLRIEATQDSGSQLISERTYKGCKKSKPKTHRGHR
jgi:hypothetical protein